MNEGPRQVLERILQQARALRDTMMFVYQTDVGNHWRFGGYRDFMRKYNALVTTAAPLLKGTEVLDAYNVDKVRGQGDTLPMEQQTYVGSVLTNTTMLIAMLEQHLGTRASDIDNLRNFFEASVRRAVFSEPESEHEVQDVVEQLLIGRGLQKGIDYDREVGRVKVSAKEVIPDFILPKLSLALEVKLIKDRARRSSLIDEINADIQSYGKAYAYMLFLVYDRGVIRDPIEFKQDLDNAANTQVVLIKH